MTTNQSVSNDWKKIHEYDPILHQAAFIGDFKKVKNMLELKEHRNIVNNKNRLGCTPLRLAATAGHVECVDLLIENGADVNVVDVKGQTPLFVAAKNKHLECVKALLKAHANPNGNTQCLTTPIYCAALEGELPVVEALALNNADLDSAQISFGPFSSTTLYISLAYHHFEIFKLLLCCGANPDSYRVITKDEWKPQYMYHAAIKHNVEADYVQWLYDFGANLFTKNEKGLFPHQMDSQNECSIYVKMIAEMPRTLKSLTRIVIRKSLTRKRLNRIDQLPLPESLKDWLRHQTVWT